MRSLAVALLLLASVLMAETQEAAYFRAMQAEEAGDIPGALEAFEDAVKLPGEYTEEIQEIINQYNQALGVPVAQTQNGDSASAMGEGPSSWSFRFLGNLGFYGLQYKEYGGVSKVSENGGDLFLSLSPYLDYTTGSWIHSFGISATVDWFLDNHNMPALDTCDWKLTVGPEYILLGRTVLVDLGVDLNAAEDDGFSPAFYVWAEKDFVHFEHQRVGAAAWAYYDTDGPMSFALYASWHRTSVYGWNGSAYLGVRFEADSVVDYRQYRANYEAALNSASANGANQGEGGYNPYGNYYDDSIPDDMGNMYRDDMMDSLWYNGENQYEEESWDDYMQDSLAERSMESISVDVPMAYGMWLGPTLRSRLSYKFKTNITIEGLLNLFYGWAVAGPDDDYKKISKLNATYGLTFYWKPGYGSIYVGFEQLYRRFSLPAYYEGVYAESSFLTEAKIGVKWEI